MLLEAYQLRQFAWTAIAYDILEWFHDTGVGWDE